jgi:hypothetical protein
VHVVVNFLRQHLNTVPASTGTYSQRCTGPTLPSTAIEYPETSAYCEGNLVDTSVRHAVQLGIYCPDFDTTAFFYNDYFLECGNISTQFGYIDDVSGNYSRFTCYESAIFAENSNQSVAQSVPALSIGTDEVWEQPANVLKCFDLISTRVVPTVAPTMGLPETVAPTSLAPSTLAPMTVAPVTAAPMVTVPPSLRPMTTAPVVLSTAAPIMVMAPTATAARSDAAATAVMTMRNVGWSCLVLFGWLGVFLV